MPDLNAADFQNKDAIINAYFREKSCDCVSAQLIRSEGPLNELEPGSIFFTLYVQDFVESSLKEKNKSNPIALHKKAYTTLNNRYYLSTVKKFDYFIVIHLL